LNAWAEAVVAACRALPETVETMPWGEGESAFKVRGRSYAFVRHGAGRAGVTAKPEPDARDAFLALPGVGPAAYVGRFGWLSLEVKDEASLGRALVLVAQSHALRMGGRGRRPRGPRRDAPA
jgi:predicted DNA-binding protein (MmcQ/YjbR family)